MRSVTHHQSDECEYRKREDSKGVGIKMTAVRTDKRQEMQDLFTEMQAKDMIQPSQSPWASPVVLVQKKDGTTRFCIEMTLNSNKPFGVQKAVFSLSSTPTSTCQYPLTISRVENHCDPAWVSRVSSILGMGYVSFRVTKFSLRYAIWFMQWTCHFSETNGPGAGWPPVVTLPSIHG